jgi:5-oxoprolinase (ATP-hydrolysing)
LRREVTLHLRPQGTENTIEVAHAPLEAMQTAFAADWQHRFGFAPEGGIVAEAVRVEAVAASRHADVPVAVLPERSGPPAGTVSMFTAGERHATPLYRREDLACGFAADGPALIVDPVSTTVVEPGWRVESTPSATSSCVAQPRTVDRAADTALDPVRLEIMSGLFMAVAEEMGAALQHSASSVNIRERLDFSCALFDRDGSLIANAPHMPVHLGSMGESVRTVLARRGQAGRRGCAPAMPMSSTRRMMAAPICPT